MAHVGSTKAPLRLKFEALTLGARLDDTIALVTSRGWKHNAQSNVANQQVTVFPPDGDPIERYKLGFEAKRLVNIQIEYLSSDSARIATMLAEYPRRRHKDDGWNLADPDGQTLIFIGDNGKQVQALYTGVLHDRTEVAAVFREALGEAPAGGQPLPIVVE